MLTAPRAAKYVEVEPDDLMPDGARLDAASLYREMCFVRMVMCTEPLELTRQRDIRGEIRGGMVGSHAGSCAQAKIFSSGDFNDFRLLGQ